MLCLKLPLPGELACEKTILNGWLEDGIGLKLSGLARHSLAFHHTGDKREDERRDSPRSIHSSR
jgi:hypothetical protein